MVRRLAGVLLLLFGLYLLYQGGMASYQYASRSGDWVSTLLDPAFLMRNAGAIFAILGGLSASLRKPGGLWGGLISTLLFGFLTAAIAGSGADQSLWRDEAQTTLVLAVLTLIFLVIKR